MMYQTVHYPVFIEVEVLRKCVCAADFNQYCADVNRKKLKVGSWSLQLRSEPTNLTRSNEAYH
jgi:hypothetical protein